MPIKYFSRGHYFVFCCPKSSTLFFVFPSSHYDMLKKDEKVLAVFNDFQDYLDEEAMWQLSKSLKP